MLLLSAALGLADWRGELPPEFLWYVEAGEASGKLPEGLARAAESLSARSRSALSHLTRFVFPAGVALVALAVGMLAYAAFGTLVAVQTEMVRAARRKPAERSRIEAARPGPSGQAEPSKEPDLRPPARLRGPEGK